eukprot:g15037.t2
MAGVLVEDREEDGFGSLFEDRKSDEDTGDDGDSALTEEEYTRPAPPLKAGLSSDTRSGVVPPTLRLSLVSSRHSLWGHRLWNAALLLAEMVDEDELVVAGKTVLELGAGAGLPSLICALKGASKVVISDYATCTDNALMVPIQINIDRVQPEFVPEGTLHAVGHVWGHPVGDLLAPLPEADSSSGGEQDDGDGRENAQTVADAGGGTASTVRPGAVGGGAGEEGFDVVIMADLLFNRSQHAQLLETCDRCLRKGRGGGSGEGTVWVSFSHHDPEKAELDMKFFELARDRGFVATRVKTVQMRDLFVENDGMDDLRGEVHLWCLKRRLTPPEP